MVDKDSAIKEVIAQLVSSSEDYAHKNEIEMHSKTYFQNDIQVYEEVMLHEVTFIYDTYILKMTLWPLLVVENPCILTTSIMFKTLDKSLFFPIRSIFGYFDILPDYFLTIPFNITPEVMKDSFNCIIEAYESIIAKIESLSRNKYDLIDFFEQEKSYMNPHIFALKQDLIKHEIATYYFSLERKYVRKEYRYYMLGDYDKSLKYFKKKKELLPYDKILVESMSTDRESKIHVAISIYEIMTGYSKEKRKLNKKEILYLVVGLLYGAIYWIALFGLYLLIRQWVARNALLVLYEPVIIGLLLMIFAVLFGFLMAFLTPKLTDKIVRVKVSSNTLLINSWDTTAWFEKVKKWLLIIVVSTSFLLVGLGVNYNLTLTSKGIVDNMSLLRIKGRFYAYDSIAYLQYRDTTPNGYGDMLDFPSYYMVLKNDEIVDISHLIDTTHKDFINVFADHGIEIRK